MSVIKDDMKNVDKQSSTLKTEPMLSSGLTLLNKAFDIDPIPSCNDQESITLDIISENSESFDSKLTVEFYMIINYGKCLA